MPYFNAKLKQTNSYTNIFLVSTFYLIILSFECRHLISVFETFETRFGVGAAKEGAASAAAQVFEAAEDRGRQLGQTAGKRTDQVCSGSLHCRYNFNVLQKLFVVFY